MASTFTTNKSIEKPASGDYNNAWAAPVNVDWDDIDAAFGGNTGIIVTGVSTGSYALTLAQYRPPNIVFTGTLIGNLVYVLPAGVGGVWTVGNFTTGAFTISIASSGGGSIGVLQGFRTSVVSDGTGVSLADTSLPAQALANAEAFATSADAVVLSTAESFASGAAATAQSNAEAFSSNANNLTSGTVPNPRLPNVGLMPGVLISLDPGGTPSGSPGTIFFYY
jgi:hypothetical protein